jgi:hypothetical protein
LTEAKAKEAALDLHAMGRAHWGARLTARDCASGW